LPNQNYPGPLPETSLTCGQCQWYSAGYNGQNCQKTREVLAETTACPEFTEVLTDPFHAVAKDKYVVGVRQEMKSSRFRINPDLFDEIRGCIVSYTFQKRDLANAHDMLQLQEYLTTIVSNRSRISSIFTHAIDVSADVEGLIDKLQLWVYSKYEIMRELKNEGLRKAAFNRLMPEYVDVNRDIQKLMETARYVDKKLQEDEGTIRAVLTSADKVWFSRSYQGPGQSGSRY
jgi:hypothetical protein